MEKILNILKSKNIGRFHRPIGGRDSAETPAPPTWKRMHEKNETQKLIDALAQTELGQITATEFLRRYIEAQETDSFRQEMYACWEQAIKQCKLDNAPLIHFNNIFDPLIDEMEKILELPQHISANLKYQGYIFKQDKQEAIEKLRQAGVNLDEQNI